MDLHPRDDSVAAQSKATQPRPSRASRDEKIFTRCFCAVAARFDKFARWDFGLSPGEEFLAEAHAMISQLLRT